MIFSHRRRRRGGGGSGQARRSGRLISVYPLSRRSTFDTHTIGQKPERSSEVASLQIMTTCIRCLEPNPLEDCIRCVSCPRSQCGPACPQNKFLADGEPMHSCSTCATMVCYICSYECDQCIIEGQPIQHQCGACYEQKLRMRINCCDSVCANGRAGCMGRR